MLLFSSLKAIDGILYICQEDRQEVESLERKEDYESTVKTIQLHISKEKGRLQEQQRYTLNKK